MLVPKMGQGHSRYFLKIVVLCNRVLKVLIQMHEQYCHKNVLLLSAERYSLLFGKGQNEQEIFYSKNNILDTIGSDVCFLCWLPDLITQVISILLWLLWWLKECRELTHLILGCFMPLWRIMKIWTLFCRCSFLEEKSDERSS